VAAQQTKDINIESLGVSFVTGAPLVEGHGLGEA
jgi:hypothetical protein